MPKPEDPKRSHSGRVETLPEPARSIGRDVRKGVESEHGEGEQAEAPDTKTKEQMEEWVATRAPGAAGVSKPDVPEQK